MANGHRAPMCDEDDCERPATTVCNLCGVMLCNEDGGGADADCPDCGMDSRLEAV